MTSMKTAKKRLLRYLIRISLYFALLFPFLSRLSSANSSSSSLSSTSSGHHDVDVATEEGSEESPSSSFLLLCTTDGNLFTIDAWSGELSSTISTDPLLRKNRASTKEKSDHDDNEDEESSFSSKTTAAIVPGLDGRLYSYMEHERHHHDGGKNNNFHPPQLQALPLTIHSILENPVRSCPSPNPEDCGILTATAQTTLLALDEKGHLLWKSREGSFATERHNRMKEESAIPPPLLLQRKDYWVQHVSTMTGQQAWNVSLGTYQALDFATTPLDDDDEEDDEQDDVDLEILLGQKQEPHSSLPAIAFSNAGRTLTAIDPDTGAVLWQQTTPSVLSSVFGINQGQWKALTVLDDKGFDDGPILEQNAEGLKFAVTRQRLPNMDAQPEDDFSDIWSQAAWEAAQTYYHRQQRLERGGDGSSSPQRLLPDRELHREAVCLPGDCPRFVDPRYNRLGLPSPDDVKLNYSKPRRHQSSEGLLLPWRLVGMILSLTVMLVFGLRLWYVNKKKKWLAETTAKKGSKMAWHASISMDGSRRVKDSRFLKRSMSLPGVLKAATSPMTTSNSGNFQPGDGNIRNEEPALSVEEKQQDEGPQVVQQGGIPLVRYSRYASEFEEIASMGKGGFGTVFRCKNGLDGREYAIKKVSIKGAANDKSFQQKFQRVVREVKILALLDHPNIVRYYTAWLEMEAEDKSNTTSPRRGVHDNSESELSRCYSSSLLLTDSVSQWDAPSPIRNTRHARIISDNPLGWDPLGIPEESSTSLRRSFRQNDDDKDGLFFEDTKNEDGKSDTGSQHDTTTRGGGEESTTWVTDTNNQEKNSADGSVDWADETETEAAALRTTKSAPVTRQESPGGTSVRYTLYIQMQLCSEHTVADFLVDDTARRGGVESSVDIPTALQLFLQISQAVAYVHEKGMIHRDLKPSNCFMDALGNIKVGDFGLSRESGGDNDTSILDTSQSQLKAFDDDHTAGVGTRSYASPEQTNGSDYDSSTDVYSLGIMLFELCYPMYTGMERNICLSRLREHSFPKDWMDLVGASFPTLQDLICRMLSRTPSARPSAKTVVEAIQSILGEFTLVSIDSSMHEGPDMILLRVEADHQEDVLGRTMELIRSAAAEEEGDNTFQIAQYGLRSSSSSERPAAIMEFAVRTPNPKKQGPKLVSSLSTSRRFARCGKSHRPFQN